MEKIFVNVDRYGNTSSASIPIALTEAIQQGRIKKDDIVVLVSFEAGLRFCKVKNGSHRMAATEWHRKTQNNSVKFCVVLWPSEVL